MLSSDDGCQKCLSLALDYANHLSINRNLIPVLQRVDSTIYWINRYPLRVVLEFSIYQISE